MAEQSPSNPTKPITVAIDFGTSNSGYAYEYTTGEESKKIDVHVNEWQVSEDDTKSTWKTPTIVLLNPHKEFDSFGYEAEINYADLCSKGENKDWYYFRRFKLLLYDTENLDIKTKIKDETGKDMVAVDVFSIALSYLKEHVISCLMAAKENAERRYFELNILWVITVPAIWSDAAKQFMRTAATKADISSNDLRLVLEPEAAAVHCRYSMLRLPVGHGDEASFDTLPEGYRYVVVDMGGGTVDIATHQVAPGGKIFELHSVVGNNIGSITFNKEFVSFLRKVFGNTFSEWKNSSPRQFLEMDRKIEGIKFRVSSSGKDVLFRIPLTLYVSILSDKYKSMKEYLSQSGNMNLSSDQEDDELRIPNGLARTFFKGTIEGITSEIHKIVREHKNIQSVILVGGQAKSAYVKGSIINAFPGQKVIIPEDPGLSVLKGAVLLGNKPEIIDGRIARFTYGIAVKDEFVVGHHREDYRQKCDDKLWCCNCFQTIIKQGTVLKYGHTFSTKTHIHAKQENTKEDTFSNPLYQSTAISPMYVTDEGCAFLGEIPMERPEGGWPDFSETIIEIVVGEAEFKFYSKDVTNNRAYEIKVDFLFPKTGTNI